MTAVVVLLAGLAGLGLGVRLFVVGQTGQGHFSGLGVLVGAVYVAVAAVGAAASAGVAVALTLTARRQIGARALVRSHWRTGFLTLVLAVVPLLMIGGSDGTTERMVHSALLALLAGHGALTLGLGKPRGPHA